MRTRMSRYSTILNPPERRSRFKYENSALTSPLDTRSTERDCADPGASARAVQEPGERPWRGVASCRVKPRRLPHYARGAEIAQAGAARGSGMISRGK
jgi:hypothetical protein